MSSRNRAGHRVGEKQRYNKEILQMGRRYAVGWSTRLLKTGDPSDVVIVVVVDPKALYSFRRDGFKLSAK